MKRKQYGEIFEDFAEDYQQPGSLTDPAVCDGDFDGIPATHTDD